MAGGDTGSHVVLPAYLSRTCCTHGRLTGWDPGWYDGFPSTPSTSRSPRDHGPVLDRAVPLRRRLQVHDGGSASSSAPVRLGLRPPGPAPQPGPACLAAATLPFLFEPSFTIYGGNLLSTWPGSTPTPSASRSPSCSSVWWPRPPDRPPPGLAAVLFAVTLLCHLIPALFAGAGAVVWLFLDADVLRLDRGARPGPPVSGGRRRLWWRVAGGHRGRADGLVALPFAVEQAYTTNMGYRRSSATPTSCSPPRPAGCWPPICRPGGPGCPPEPGGPVRRRHGRACRPRA